MTTVGRGVWWVGKERRTCRNTRGAAQYSGIVPKAELQYTSSVSAPVTTAFHGLGASHA